MKSTPHVGKRKADRMNLQGQEGYKSAAFDIKRRASRVPLAGDLKPNYLS